MLYEKLQQITDNADEAYFNNGSRVITDEIYHLLNTLTDNKIGTKPKSGELLPFRMYSLQKFYAPITVYDWLRKINISSRDVVKMPKCDGIAIQIHYDADGILSAIYTRGNGIYGTRVPSSILDNLSTKLPITIPFSDVSIIAELVVSDDNLRGLEKISYRYVDNLAAAYAFLHNQTNTPPSPLCSIVGYRLAYKKTSGVQLSSYLDMLKIIKSLKILTPMIQPATSNKEFTTRLPTDGVVYMINDLAMWNVLGATDHHPRYAMAIKPTPKHILAVVDNVELSIGATGSVTSIVSVNVIETSNTDMSRSIKTVNQGSYNLTLERSLTKGAIVAIIRAGNIVPNISTIISNDGDPISLVCKHNNKLCANTSKLFGGMSATYVTDPTCKCRNDSLIDHISSLINIDKANLQHDNILDILNTAISNIFDPKLMLLTPAIPGINVRAINKLNLDTIFEFDNPYIALIKRLRSPIVAHLPYLEPYLLMCKKQLESVM